MMFEFGKSTLLVPALLTVSIGLVGCGGSSSGGSSNGGGGGDTSSAGITVLPERFNFGLVTEGNLPDVGPRTFTLSNEGETSYSISNMSLTGTDPADFVLDEFGGAAPCEALTLNLAPDDSCTVAVSFAPRSFDSFNAALLLRTNDPNAASVARSLSGTYAEVEEINLTVNQINACPRSQAAQAFITVTDQAGFPIRDLTLDDFTLEELGIGPVSNPTVTPVGQSNTALALSHVMDYSGSMVRADGAIENMEEAANTLINGMQANDVADVIKYAAEIRFMLEDFTSNREALQAAIAEDPQFEGGTAFYDATVAAIARLGPRDEDRRVVISLTDGRDTRSENNLDETIMEALGTDIPVFTVGFGRVDVEELRALAEDTGGLFYNPAGDANLQQVAQQLTSLLFKDQYVITFDSALDDGESGSLEVKAEFVKDDTPFKGVGSKTILACQ